MRGAGTTCKMAKLNNRIYIGIDLNEEYVNISEKRVEVTPYTKDNPNEKVKFLVSREENLERRRKSKNKEMEE